MRVQLRRDRPQIFHSVYKKSRFGAKVSRYNSENVQGTDEVSRKVSFYAASCRVKLSLHSRWVFLSKYTGFGMQNIFL